MRVRFPTESVMLGIVMFSGGLREAMSAGILLLAAFVLAEFLYGILEEALPSWSLWLCLLAGTGVLLGCAMEAAFFALQMERSLPLWIMQGVLGVLAAKDVLENPSNGDYDGIFFEYAIIWGLWILLGGIREFWAGGMLAGYGIVQGAFITKGILQTSFGFLGAGIVLAAACSILKKGPVKKTAAYLLLPILWYYPAFELGSVPYFVSILSAGAVTWILYDSVRRKLIYSQADGAFGGMPLDLLSLGILYMILGIF